MNCCHFKGCLTSDVELKKTRNDKSVVNFSIAVKHFVKDKPPEVSYFDFEAWGTIAEILAEKAYKGRHILITCQAKNHKWQTKEGEQKKAIRFRVMAFEWVSYNEDRRPENTVQAEPEMSDEDEVPFDVETSELQF